MPNNSYYLHDDLRNAFLSRIMTVALVLKYVFQNVKERTYFFFTCSIMLLAKIFAKVSLRYVK